MSEVVCACCGEQRNELRAQKSKLLEGLRFVACTKCKKGGFEPRYVIILVGRSEGTTKVAEYIRNRRYKGEPILAHELIA